MENPLMIWKEERKSVASRKTDPNYKKKLFIFDVFMLHLFGWFNYIQRALLVIINKFEFFFSIMQLHCKI